MTRRMLLLSLFVTSLAGTIHAAEQPPIEVTSPHFSVFTDSNEKQARRILDNFEHMRWMFQTLYPKADVDPPIPIIVLAMKNRKGFQSVEPETYRAKNQLDIAGLFLKTQDKNYVLLRLDAEGEHPYSIIFHEYTHLQFSVAGEWMPLWLNEGIAEFYQNTDFREKTVVLGQPSTADLLYLRQNQTIPLTTLLSVDRDSPYYHKEDKGSVFYAESWALTHYLEVKDREKGTHQLADYMSLMSQHQDPVASAEKAFGDLKQLQNDLRLYIQQQQYKQFTLSSASAPLDPASYKVKTLTQTEFDAHRADFLACIGRTNDAHALLDSVMQADPKNEQARETMGFLELRKGNHAAALKWYAEAVKLDPQSYLANYYFAILSMNNAAPSDYAQIESSLRASIQFNPGFAAAYDRLASWLCTRQEKLDEAQALDLKAIHLDRGNFAYRMNAANLLMIRGKLDDAEKVLKATQKLAKSPEESAMMQSRIRQLSGMRAGRPANSPTVETIAVDAAAKHPPEPRDGPKQIVVGVIRDVHCSESSTLEFRVEVVEKGGQKLISLYNNNFYKLDFTSVGFTPRDDMDPCRDLEGVKAQVQYAKSSDKSVDGQALAIELQK